ncbi:NepR family anti-sigma factor [Jiella sp. M17.18]|uniref:NepR family anti-sigma factor n=1 Tax=Jiella sp. M17.18 TaxID=3234247 RepID=UPI0034DEBD14
MDDRETKDDMLQTTHAQRSQAGAPDLGANTAIGKRLKAYYDDVASEPVPDRFLALLDALDKAESASKTSDRE